MALVSNVDDLKPCPFCGGEAIIDHLGQDADRGYFIRCDRCEVQQIAIYTIAGAKQRWNRREPADT